MKRRTLFSTALGLGLAAVLPRASAASGRVLIIGGGWGGLAAARSLRTLAPQLEVTLIERNAAFWSRPLSNRWLVGLADSRSLSHDYASAARTHGYRFLNTEVTAIERDKRRVITRDGALGYDWLVIAAGIREDFSPWFGVDRKTVGEYTRQNFPSAFADSDGHLRLKAKIENFTGGDLVMTIPPMPYRCPPAPYERAGLIAWWMKTRRIKGRLIIIDPNQPALGFERVFRDAYPEQVTYLPQAQVKNIDPYKKQIVTDFDTIDFTDAILMPPQQAAEIIWQAGLIGQNDAGQASGWGAQSPITLQAQADPHIYLVGDLIDKASQLFGYYPKTGQMAARQGEIVAHQIAARAAGKTAETQLPDSTCHVINRVEPLETTQIDTTYRLRGDGLIQQTMRQHYNAQASDEDLRWAQAMFAELGF